MTNLRARILLVVGLAAVLPVVGASLWARKSITRSAQAQYDRRLDATVQAVRREIGERTRDQQRVLARLCERDLLIDRTVMELATERLTPERQDELVQLLPALMRSVGLDTLEILDKDSGRVLGAAHYPGRADARDPSLVQAVHDAGGAPFARQVRVQDRGEARNALTLLVACSVHRGQSAAVVVGGRHLDGFTSALGTEHGPVRVSLVARSPDGSGPVGTDVHEFVDHLGRPVASLVGLIDDSELRTQLEELDRVFLLGGGAGVVVAVLLGLLLGWAVSRPLGELETAARRVGTGDLDSTINVRSGGEVGRALTAFNDMTRDLRSVRRRLLRAERIAAWREIARRIAHEIKNPLSPIQMSIETMRKTYEKKHPDFDEIFQESTLTILEEVERMKRIVTEFSQFARMPRPKPEDLAVADLIGHIDGLYQGDGADGRLETEVPPELPTIRADREQLTQVLVNLVQNAFQAASAKHGRGGRVRLAATPQENGVRITVEDNGPGIAQEDRERVFEPYFTNRAAGTGLGLAIVHRIIDDHRGTVEITDSSLGGASVVVFLSAEGPPREADASASATDTAVPLTRRRNL